MIEIYIAIALICQVHPGAGYSDTVNDVQKKCQKQLAKCWLESKEKNNTLMYCLANSREIK